MTRRNPIELEGRKTEARLARALERAFRKFRGSVAIHDLMVALQLRDVRLALSLFDKAKLQDALSPPAAIAQDSVTRGGRITAKKINAQSG